MSQDEALLSVDRLGVSFRSSRGASVALRDVSLELRAGEILALLGESGAGKSLLCRSISGLVDTRAAEFSGEIRLAGQAVDPRGGPSMRGLWGKRVSMIFQDPKSCLNPVERVGAQIVETLRLHHPLSKARAEERAAELLAEVGLPDPPGCARAWPHELSGGMCQRIAIAMALSSQPELLIADEPTAALDTVQRRRILHLLVDQCRKGGSALLLVTHDLVAARATADRVAVIYAGAVVESGPASSVLNSPLHPYTAGLIQCAPRLGDRVTRLDTIDGLPPGAAEDRTGCAFAPRCAQEFDVCARQQPQSMAIGSSVVACHLHAEEPNG